MRLGTFDANIIVDGAAREEYDVVSESPTKVTCWVASEEGKCFSIQWKCHEESRVTAALGKVHVDGIWCGGKWIKPGTLGVRDTCTLSYFIDATSTRDFMFARIQLSDDDSLLGKEVHKNFGQISLEICRGEAVKKNRRPAQDRGVPSGNERLHERSKKAMVHCVGFGPVKARKLRSYKRRLGLVHDDQPEITFEFRYRPLDILQANGIAPRPTPTNADNGHANGPGGDDYTYEDIKPAQLNDRIQNLEKELKRLRDLQASGSEDRKPKQIKTEDSMERRRLFAPGEVIDLT